MTKSRRTSDLVNSILVNPNNSVNIHEGTESPYFLLTTGATPTPQQGMLFWDQDRSTVGLQMNGVEARLGQDNFWYVKNQTGSPIPKGTGVMAVGALGASSRILVAPMVADGSVEAKYFLGITAEEILDGEDGFVTNIGKIRGIDTSVYGASAGQILYCDPVTPGGFTITQPQAPNLDIAAAFTVDYKSNGTIAVRAFPGYELSELHDVYINTPSDQDILLYNGTNSRWENTPISTAVPTPTLDAVTTAGNTTANDIEVGGLNLSTNVSITSLNAYSLNYAIFKALTAGQGISVSFQPSGTPSGYAYNFQFNKSSTANSNSLLFIGGGSAASAAANKHLITTSTDGTATAQPLAFAVATGNWASATPLMTLTPTQNVLIGTTTDAGYKLTIDGTYFQNAGSSIPIIVKTTNYDVAQYFSTALYAGFRVIARNSDGVPYIGLNTSSTISSNGVGTQKAFFAYWGDTANYSSLGYGNNTNVIAFSNATGNVVINTGTTFTDAGYKLDVNGTTRLNGNSYINGNLGIGVVTPAQELHLLGTFRSQAKTGSDNVFFEGVNSAGTMVAQMAEASSAGFGGLRFNGQRNNATGGAGIQFSGYVGTSSGNVSALDFRANGGTIGSRTTHPTSVPIAKFSRMSSPTTVKDELIVYGDGNVGINTTSNSGYKLDVNGTARVSGNLTVDTNTLYVDATNDRVGIGKTPSQKLDVNGNIYTSSGNIGLHRYGGNGGGTLFLVGFDNNHAMWNGFYGDDPSTASGNNTFDGIYWRTYRGIRIKGGWLGAVNLITAENSGSSTPDHVVKLYASGAEKLATSTAGVTITGSATAGSFIKTGGTASEFLKADGSVDTNAYLTTETQTLDDVTTLGNTTSNSITASGMMLGDVHGVSGYSGIKNSSVGNSDYAVLQATNGYTIFNTASTSVLDFRVGNSPAMRLSNSKNFLIGTTTDSGYRLDVNGTARVSGDLTVDSGFANEGDRIELRPADAIAEVRAAGESTADEAAIFLGTPYTAGSYIAPTKAAIIAQGVGTYSRSKIHFCLEDTPSNFLSATVTSADARVTITKEGRLGVNNTSPSYELDVNGDTNTTGSYYVNGTAGWSGTITISSNPTGQQNIDVQGGIIVNVY